MISDIKYSLPGQFSNVNKAFSNQSRIFDEKVEANGITRWMRTRVRNHVLSVLSPGSRILELNAGTGLDAAFFATYGHTVHATDISDGMVSKIEEKINEGAKNISAEKRSFTDLSDLPSASFDCIFSNFGGLNCTPDLKSVIAQFGRLLKPEGTVVLVIMPRLCPWELSWVLKGRFRRAFRRLRHKGTFSHLEGEFFTTWYYNPSKVISYFGDSFRIHGLNGLASIVPPPYRETFPQRHPWIFSKLCEIEERVSHRWPFNRTADHYILTMKLTG